VFEYGVEIPPIECKGRESANISSAKRAQQTISLVYSILISAIAFSLGVGFLFFGQKIYSTLTETSKSKKASHKKVRV
jgi:hypothetical protein